MIGEKANDGLLSLFAIYSSGGLSNVISLEVVEYLFKEYVHLLIKISSFYYFYRFSSTNTLTAATLM